MTTYQQNITTDSGLEFTAVICDGVAFVNKTPHVLNVVSEDGSTIVIPASLPAARVSQSSQQVASIGGFAISACVMGDVVDLPAADSVDGKTVYFITSTLVKSAVPERGDVLCPGELIRDEHNQPVGCRGLKVF